MSAIKRPEWPVLVRDGGWREVRHAHRYFPTYLRYRKGVKQTITWCESFGSGGTQWVLEFGSNMVISGGLDKCLLRAEA